MKSYKSKELNYLTKRGYIKQLTHLDELDNLFASGEKITFYAGFDCTAKSLHVGHLIPIMVMKYLVKMGHRAIIILGTVTAQIGDPSLKSEQRKLLAKSDVEENYQSISKLMRKFLSSDESDNDSSVICLKNDWLESMNLVDFLRDYGVHFSVNKMINMETFSERLRNQKSLSFLEFSYSLFQAFDFAYLYNKYNCRLQIGGSDQWGNIVAGLDLCQKLYNGANVFGATVNLLLNSSGEKMGKTVGGAVWLDSNLLSVFDYWQYFRNIADSDIIKIALLLTELSDDEIEKIKNKLSEAKQAEEINQVKISLATEVTKICHGFDLANKAEEEARIKFNSKDDFANVKNDLLLKENDISEMKVMDLLKKVASDKSNSQLKTLIVQNSIKINDVPVNQIDFKIDSRLFENYEGRRLLRLSIGKKERFVVEIRA